MTPTEMEARIAVLEAERDRAREDCGHQRAMRQAQYEELQRFVRFHIDCKREHLPVEVGAGKAVTP